MTPFQITRAMLALVAVLLSHGASAQMLPKRGEYVTLKFPEDLLQPEKSRWGVSTRVAHLSRSPTGTLLLGGHETWAPPRRLRSYSVSKISSDPKCNCTDIDLSDFPDNIRLRFDGITYGELRILLPSVVAFGKEGEPDAIAYRDAVRERAADSMFVDELANVPVETRRALIAAVNPTAESVLSGRIGITTYKNSKYVFLNLGDSDTVFNALKLNQAARMARVINDEILPLVKLVLPHVENIGGIAGVRISTKLFNKSFAEEYAIPDIEPLDVYVPMGAIRKFADADITSQQMMDAAVVLLNDNRVQVNLAQ